MNALKQMLGPEWRFRTHRLGRLRWLTKYRLARRSSAGVSLRRKLAFILLDPEVESFSYQPDNEAQVLAGLARALGCPAQELLAYAEETRQDPELNERLARHLRWRPHLKRRPKLGNRLAWYVLVRARKPALVVETGIYQGLGSLALLRALERNAQEGAAGELISFDVVAGAGEIVREELRGRWRRVTGSTRETLLPELAGRRVDMLFHDTPHTEENQRFEFEAALAHAGPRLLLLDASGGQCPTLQSICRERGCSYHSVPMPSRGHVYAGSAIAFGIFDAPGPS